MAKKLILGPNLTRFGPNLVPKIIFRRFYLYLMLGIDANYHCMKHQEKNNEPNLRKWQKT